MPNVRPPIEEQSRQIGRPVQGRHRMRQQSLLAVVFGIDESPVVQQVRSDLMSQPEASFSQQDLDVRQSRFASLIGHVDVDPAAQDIVDPADQNDGRPLFICMSVSGFCLGN